MNLTDELVLCDDEYILSNKDKLFRIGKLLGVEADFFNDIPNKGCNTENRETEGRKIMIAKHIFKEFLETITYLICTDNKTFHKHKDLQGTNVYQSLKLF